MNAPYRARCSRLRGLAGARERAAAIRYGPMGGIESLREHMAELADLEGLEMLATWDQHVTMPREGGGSRAQQLGTLARIAHERATAEQIGALLDELKDAELSELDRDIVRLARRDWERARRIPPELAAERSRAQAAGQEIWREAR